MKKLNKVNLNKLKLNKVIKLVMRFFCFIVLLFYAFILNADDLNSVKPVSTVNADYVNSVNVASAENNPSNPNNSSNSVNPDSNDSLTALKTLLSPIVSLKGQFSQVVLNDKGQVLQKNSGNVWLKKPGQFRWEVEGNDPRWVISDGTQVWDYDQELSQVTIQKFSKGQSSAPIYFLTGEVNTIDKDFKVKALTSDQTKKADNTKIADKISEKSSDEAKISDKTKKPDASHEKSSQTGCLKHSDTCFELLPKNSDDSFQSIQLGFKDKILKEIRLTDQLGQHSEFVFNNIELNPVIETTVFKFRPPKGVDVVNAE